MAGELAEGPLSGRRACAHLIELGVLEQVGRYGSGERLRVHHRETRGNRVELRVDDGVVLVEAPFVVLTPYARGVGDVPQTREQYQAIEVLCERAGERAPRLRSALARDELRFRETPLMMGDAVELVAHVERSAFATAGYRSAAAAPQATTPLAEGESLFRASGDAELVDLSLLRAPASQ